MVDTALLLALIISFATIYLYNRKPKPSHPLPPGPPQTFFLGNARDVPAAHKELKFAEWGKKYGTCSSLSYSLRGVMTRGRFLLSALAVSFLGRRRSSHISQRLWSSHHHPKHGQGMHGSSR